MKFINSDKHNRMNRTKEKETHTREKWENNRWGYEVESYTHTHTS